jgi:CRISPR-associated protein Cas1
MAEGKSTARTSPIPKTRVEKVFLDQPDPTNVAVIDGYGVRVSVDRGHLQLRDGVAEVTRDRHYAKATHGLSRVTVLASTGDLSIAALKWCAGAGVGLVVIDPFDGRILATSAHTQNDDPRLRRAQALALDSGVGLSLSRLLISRKLQGQGELTLRRFGAAREAKTIDILREEVAAARSLEELRQLEASAANLYFSVWREYEVPFIGKDLSKVPLEWRKFEGRRSAVYAGTARSATDPLNAMLNFAYRLLEAEGRIACLSVGLDPGLGVLHADVKNRDSMVLDLIEPLRPVVDDFCFDLLRRRPLKKADLHEDARGVVRLRAPLTHEIVEGSATWQKKLGRVVEEVASLLGKASPYDVNVPSVLTRDKYRKATRESVKKSPAAEEVKKRGPNSGGISSPAKKKQHATAAPRVALFRACVECGVILPREVDRIATRAKYCDPCRKTRRIEIGRIIQTTVKEKREILPETKQLRSQKNASSRMEQKKWDEEHGGEVFDRSWFLHEVTPKLVGVSLSEISRATGISTSAAAQIRSGKRVPHPRHWQAIEVLVAETEFSRVLS